MKEEKIALVAKIRGKSRGVPSIPRIVLLIPRGDMVERIKSYFNNPCLERKNALKVRDRGFT